MREPKPHKHAALMAEWIKDTSRVVEYRATEDDMWCVDDNPRFDRRYEYRFKPELGVVSSLNDLEIANICSLYDDYTVRGRMIANAAATREREDIILKIKYVFKNMMSGALLNGNTVVHIIESVNDYAER